jgi:hypothetical protein
LIEDPEVALVFEHNNASLKKPWSFVWTDKWFICLPKCHVSLLKRVLNCEQHCSFFPISMRIICNLIKQGLTVCLCDCYGIKIICNLNILILWDVTPCNLVCMYQHLKRAYFLCHNLFNPEDGGRMFLRNVSMCTSIPDYLTSHPRWQYSSHSLFWELRIVIAVSFQFSDAFYEPCSNTGPSICDEQMGQPLGEFSFSVQVIRWILSWNMLLVLMSFDSVIGKQYCNTGMTVQGCALVFCSVTTFIGTNVIIIIIIY